MNYFRHSQPPKDFLREIVTPEDPDIDIVAVHGLNPTNKEFHAEETWTAGGKLWLRDFLPKRLPRARVLLYGYNSNVAFETSTAGVSEQAENLLNRLSLKRTDAPNRPIIFICHSLGGIVVKRALVHSKLDDTYSPIRNATYGIAFFGTPHQGGNFAGLGTIAASIARATLRNPGNSFMKALQKDSLFSEGLIKDFRHMLENYHILSFYETLPLKKIGLIVDQKSATLGLPGSRERQIAMHADHRNVCKFEDIDGENYEIVIGNIAMLVEQATAIRPAPDTTTVVPVPDARAITPVPDTAAVDPVPDMALLTLSPVSSRTDTDGTVFIVPYTKNQDFIGREDIIGRLKDVLLATEGDNAYQGRAALFGLGGVGKSQIAIEYAYWLQKECPHHSIFWIRGGNVESFLQSLNQISQEFDIPGADDSTADRAALLKGWLESRQSGRWLAIIDNVDDGEIFFSGKDVEGVVNNSKPAGALARYIPDCSHGSVLMTTRDKAVASKFTRGSSRGLVEVKKMTGMESVELVQKKLDVNQNDDLLELTDLLENLPLALAQAAAFIQENSITVREYIELYKAGDDSKTELLSEAFETIGRDSEVPNAVVATWTISFDQISKRSPRAAEMLSMMTFFDRQGIPKQLLEKEDESRIEFTKALGILKAFSLATETSGGNTFDMHRLVQLVIRKWIVANEKFDLWAEKALEKVADLYPRNARIKNWKACALYLPHAQAVLGCGSKSVEQASNMTRIDLIAVISDYLSTQGRWSESEDLNKEVLAARREILGPDHRRTLNAMRELALTYKDQRKLDMAETLLSHVVNGQKKLYGAEAQSTLFSLELLASIYQKQGRVAEAEELLLRIIEARSRIQAGEIGSSLKVKHRLANNYSKQGRYDEAEKLFEEILQGYQKLFDKNDQSLIRSRLNTQHSLAVLYGKQKRWKEAEELILEVVESQKVVIGPENPRTVNSMVVLAQVYRGQGRNEEAVGLMKHVIEICTRIMGPNDSYTLLYTRLLHRWSRDL